MVDNTEWLRTLGADLLKFIGPAIIVRPLTDSPKDILFNGTFSYVDTGFVKLLVTAAHVYDHTRYLRTCNEMYKRPKFLDSELEDKPCIPDEKVELVWFPGARQQNVRLTDEVPLAHNHETIDLCTYACRYPLENAGKAWYISDAWPPARAVVGDQVIGIGFPGKDRRIVESGVDKGLHMVASIVSGRVVSCSDRHFVLADEDLERQVVSLTDQTSELQFGGMSGGIFFRIVDEPETVRFTLVGFLYEVYDIHRHGHDKHANLYVTHADFILADGTIDQSKLF